MSAFGIIRIGLVYDYARVYDNAEVSGYSKVRGNAEVNGNDLVYANDNVTKSKRDIIPMFDADEW